MKIYFKILDMAKFRLVFTFHKPLSCQTIKEKPVCQEVGRLGSEEWGAQFKDNTRHFRKFTYSVVPFFFFTDEMVPFIHEANTYLVTTMCQKLFYAQELLSGKQDKDPALTFQSCMHVLYVYMWKVT